MTFHGAFIFRKQDHGILSSTYFNNEALKPYPETAIRTDPDAENPSDIFAGKYQTVWLENTGCYNYTLIIKQSNQPGVYEMKWETNGGPNYYGSAMLESGNLVGFYSKV